MKDWLIKNIIQTEAMQDFLLKTSAALITAFIVLVWASAFWGAYQLWQLF